MMCFLGTPISTTSAFSAIALSVPDPCGVMTGPSRPKDGVASLAYVPAIHVFGIIRRGCPAQGRA
jgi:hypothetical protein